MKVLIIGNEQCGIINDLAIGAKDAGHRVMTIANGDKYFSHSYNLLLDDFWKGIHLSRALKPIPGIRIPERFLTGRFGIAIARRNLEQILKSVDIVIQVWGIQRHQLLLLELAEKLKKPFGIIFMGSDIRDYNHFINHYDVGGWRPPSSYLSEPTSTKIARIRLFEQYASAIFSSQDQMGLAQRPYFRIRTPLDLAKFHPSIPSRDIPKILHAPTNTGIKGTELIESTLTSLELSGIPFSYTRLQGLPNSELLKALSDSDIVLDQVILHGPAWLAMESLACGNAVAARLIDEPSSSQIPVWPICPNSIKSQLIELLRNKDLRISLAKRGIDYTKQHSRQEIAKYYIDRLLEPFQFESELIQP